MERFFFTCCYANCGAKRRLKVGYSNVNVRCTRLLGVVRCCGDDKGELTQHTNSSAIGLRQAQRKKYTNFKVRPETMWIYKDQAFSNQAIILNIITHRKLPIP